MSGDRVIVIVMIALWAVNCALWWCEVKRRQRRRDQNRRILAEIRRHIEVEE